MVACCVALERIEWEFERDRWFSADEAKRYGLIYHLIESSGDSRIVAAQPNGRS